MTTTTATPAERMLTTLWIEPDHAAAALTDSRAALLSWAGRDGQYSHSDVEAILQGHGETFGAWVNNCAKHNNDGLYDAETLLTWLGY